MEEPVKERRTRLQVVPNNSGKWSKGPRVVRLPLVSEQGVLRGDFLSTGAESLILFYLFFSRAAGLWDLSSPTRVEPGPRQ